MQEINLEAFATELTDSVYYKRIQKELREKRIKTEALKKQAETDPLSPYKLPEQKETNKTKKPILSDYDYKDDITISSHTHQKEKNKAEKQKRFQINKLKQNLKYNAKEIMRHLSHKIDFTSRQDEFKEMYKFNLQESRSHNIFVSRFAKFKVGIVGRVLSEIGTPISELKTLQKEAFKQMFQENTSEMKENIYTSELMEIINGRTQKSRHKIKKFTTLQGHIIQQMNNIGRIGFWSKKKLIEEKINQCNRIKEEFQEEIGHLTYLLEFVDQEKKNPS